MNRLKIAQPAGVTAPPAIVVIQQPRGGFNNRHLDQRRTPAALKDWAIRSGYVLAGKRQARAAA